ncbi:DUF4192 domain-containing protein [Agromyces sp. SYSU T0242]|uniref:DUF4192 domain-containing protein n=1 Tax=Agromyces litoreus TaxID=3158561 RepID=UPI003398017F
MTTTIRADAAHDFLALVPHLLGYHPKRSLVCVAFAGNRSIGALRHDLPPGERAESVAVSVLGMVCRVARVDGVVPVVYADAPSGDVHAAHGPLLAAVVRRAEEAGFEVRDALWVAADGWGSLFDDAVPPGGRRLELIRDSPAARAAEREGDAMLAESAAHLVRVPAPDPSRARAMAEALGAVDEAADPHELAERISSGVGEPAVDELARFLLLAEHPPIRDALMLQVAFGRGVGESALAASGGGALDEGLADLLLGRTSIGPDVDRVRACLASIVPAIGDAPQGRRSGALCIAGWLAWTLGRGSAAGELVTLALDETPGHTMAGLLQRFLGTGALPAWAFGAPSASSTAERSRAPGP